MVVSSPSLPAWQKYHPAKRSYLTTQKWSFAISTLLTTKMLVLSLFFYQHDKKTHPATLRNGHLPSTLLATNVGRPAAVREKQHNTLEDSDIINKRVKNAEGHDDGFFFLHLRNITTIDVHVSTSFKNHWINFIATKKSMLPETDS